MKKLPYFKNYDIRGRIGTDLTKDVMGRIARAYAQVFAPRLVVIGHDIRPTSSGFADALAAGFVEMGTDVIRLGLCGTEEVYFATEYFKTDGAMMVTASHNPIQYNGIKIVGPGCTPVSEATGLEKIEEVIRLGLPTPPAAAPGRLREATCRAEYAVRVASFLGDAPVRGIRMLVNAGNGVAGPAFDAVLAALEDRGCEIAVERLHHVPDGSFPNGIPNPMLPETHPQSAEPLRASGADLGIAWDGDFDRCFFFDETGAFVDGEYMVALIASSFLESKEAPCIVHDVRVVRAVREIVIAGGGTPCIAPVGHSNMKRRMRETGAVYGGEMSAHHYFREFMFCDSGMIPWVLVLRLMARSGRSLGSLVADFRERFPSSGEINLDISDTSAALARIERAFGPEAKTVDRLDGLSLEFENWRLNLRPSNTEPILRLNLEAGGDRALLETKLRLVTAILEKAD